MSLFDDYIRSNRHRALSITVFGIAAVLGAITLLVAGGLWIRSWSAPAAERIRRDTYMESQAHIDGTVRQLEGLRREWSEAADARRQMFEAQALRQASNVRFSDLEESAPYVAAWIDSLRGTR